MVCPPELAGFRNALRQYCIRTRSNLLGSGTQIAGWSEPGSRLPNRSLQARGKKAAVTYVSFVCEVTHVTS
jgi:hypothetical protein